MDKQKQNEAVCDWLNRWCGHTDAPAFQVSQSGEADYRDGICIEYGQMQEGHYCPREDAELVVEVPPFTNSLDSCADTFEKAMNAEEKNIYRIELYDTWGYGGKDSGMEGDTSWDDFLINLTATQRTEAFLRANDLWVEE